MTGGKGSINNQWVSQLPPWREGHLVVTPEWGVLYSSWSTVPFVPTPSNVAGSSAGEWRRRRKLPQGTPVVDEGTEEAQAYIIGGKRKVESTTGMPAGKVGLVGDTSS